MAHQLETIDDLKPAPYNPRTISKKAAAGLAKSIESYADVSGIVWNARTGHLVTGHQRVDQLRKLGARLRVFDDGKQAELILQGGESFDIRVVDWPLEKEKAANVVANNPHVAGEWTDGLGDILAAIKLEIPEDDFADLRLDSLWRDVGRAVGQDEVPEPTGAPTTKPGDVWEMGKHLLFCAECDTVELPELFECMVTDPPYGVSYSAKNEFLNEVDKGNRVQTEIENDSHTPKQMSELWLKWFTAIRAFAKPGASCYVTGPQGGALLRLLYDALCKSGFSIKQELIWVKNNHVLGRSDYNYKHESILYGWVGGAAHRFHGGQGKTSVWEFDRPHQSKLHPTMKPVALFAKAIEHSTLGGELVVDPFLGSGTTLIACEELGRRCHGVELSPAYCDVIVERWQNLTGRKAKRRK